MIYNQINELKKEKLEMKSNNPKIELQQELSKSGESTSKSDQEFKKIQHIRKQSMINNPTSPILSDEIDKKQINRKMSKSPKKKIIIKRKISRKKNQFDSPGIKEYAALPIFPTHDAKI